MQYNKNKKGICVQKNQDKFDKNDDLISMHIKIHKNKPVYI